MIQPPEAPAIEVNLRDRFGVVCHNIDTIGPHNALVTSADKKEIAQTDDVGTPEPGRRYRLEMHKNNASSSIENLAAWTYPRHRHAIAR